MNNVIHRSIEDKTGEKVFGFFVRLSFNIFRLFYIIPRENKQTTNWSKMRAFKLKWEYERQMSVCFAHISPHSHIRHSNWHMKYRALLNVLKCNEMAFYRSISFSFRVRACACRACLCIKKHVKRVLRLSKHIKQHCKNDKIIASQLLCFVCLCVWDGRYTIESGFYGCLCGNCMDSAHSRESRHRTQAPQLLKY